jgi:hypothetical protein
MCRSWCCCRRVFLEGVFIEGNLVIYIVGGIKFAG